MKGYPSASCLLSLYGRQTIMLNFLFHILFGAVASAHFEELDGHVSDGIVLLQTAATPVFGRPEDLKPQDADPRNAFAAAQASANDTDEYKSESSEEQEQEGLPDFMKSAWDKMTGGQGNVGDEAREPDAKLEGADVILPEDTQYDSIFLQYIPAHNVAVCGLGKCGTTSLYQFVYEQVFGMGWPFDEHEEPYIQDIESSRWNGTFEMITDPIQRAGIMNEAYTFALIRDPKERLLSAWKSKVACNDKFGVDENDRSHWVESEHRYRGFVAALQRLRGAEENITCLGLLEYATALSEIKQLGRQEYLDRHFLAQDKGCFLEYGPAKWSRVAVIDGQFAMKELRQQLGSGSAMEIPSSHSSTRTITVTEQINALLDEATKDEYEMLKDFLPNGYESRVQPGEVVIDINDGGQGRILSTEEVEAASDYPEALG